MAPASAAASSAAIELLQSHSLTTLVQRELERRILAGELEPGDKLTEEDIAGALNVSRGPVREAFRALEQAGLVRMEKNRGVFVRQVSRRGRRRDLRGARGPGRADRAPPRRRASSRASSLSCASS